MVIFEPASVNAEYLKKRFMKNPKVIVEEKAVALESGIGKLYADAEGSPIASLTRRRLDHFEIDFSHTEEISLVRFEDYWKTELSSQGIDFLKLDIEGHELDALKGMGESLNLTKLIQFEFGGCNIDTRTFFQDFWYFFTSRNFELYRITPFGPIKISRYSEMDETFSTTNYLARNMR